MYICIYMYIYMSICVNVYIYIISNINTNMTAWKIMVCNMKIHLQMVGVFPLSRSLFRGVYILIMDIEYIIYMDRNEL